MLLIKANKDFVIRGRPYDGFPILLHDSMESCIPANEFFRYYLFRGAIGSRRSWESTARALYDYFGFLQAHDLDWRDTKRAENTNLIAVYRDYSLDTIGLARSTVKQRLLYICEFYNYAHAQKWVERLPFSFETRRVRAPRNGFLAHAQSDNHETLVRDVSLKVHRDLPKFLSTEQVKQLLGAATNPHHRMIVRLGLQTGLRREEIATFPVAYVVNPSRFNVASRSIRVHLDPHDGNGMRCKGDKARDIFIGHSLMTALHHYVVHVRGERGSLSQTKSRHLFLNHRREPFAADGKRLERIVRDLGRRVGIRVHPHMLRHTNATHTLSAMQRAEAGIDPLVYVQRQLGHASIQTTMVYLHLVNERAERAMLAYDDELNDWMDP